MRLGLVVIALAACSGPGAASASPSWPKATVSEVDGGESLAPRAAARAVAAIVEDDKPADKAAPDKPLAASGGPSGPSGSTADKPAAASSAATPLEDSNDYIIEIED